MSAPTVDYLTLRKSDPASHYTPNLAAVILKCRDCQPRKHLSPSQVRFLLTNQQVQVMETLWSRAFCLLP